MKRNALAKPGPTPVTPTTARKSARLSREELAAKAGVSFSTVCRVEQTGEFPRQQKVRDRYLKALELTEDQVAEPAKVGAK